MRSKNLKEAGLTKFLHFLKVDVPKLIYNGKILYALGKYGDSLDLSDFKNSVLWHQPPWVEVCNDASFDGWLAKQYFVTNAGGSSWTWANACINVPELFAKKFEKEPTKANKQRVLRFVCDGLLEISQYQHGGKTLDGESTEIHMRWWDTIGRFNFEVWGTHMAF